MNSSYRDVLDDIEAQADERGWPIIGPEKGTLLVDLMRKHNPKRVLELGALVGYSSTLMAANLGPESRVISIEIDHLNAELTRENQRRAGVADRCQVLEGPALKVIPTLDGQFDFVFIDANKEQYLAYLNAVEPFLASGAVIVADNVKAFSDEIAPYLDYVRNSDRYHSTYHDFGRDGVEVSVRLE